MASTIPDTMKDLKEFDGTKVGVKGLADSGVTKIPRIFICPPETNHQSFPNNSSSPSLPPVPIINLDGFASAPARRAEIADEIRRALETWGFFQMVNHGVPASVLANLLSSAREFYEQPEETRTEFYSRDQARKVKYYSSGDMYQTKTAQWRDTLSWDFEDACKLDLESLPQICRKAFGEYMKSMIELRNALSELISEALGLGSDHLSSLGCFEVRRLLCHYYPPCPEPELTMGIKKHSDPYFLTILLQDDIGGLQIFHQNQWLDVPPVEGSLIVNAGDLLQLITNDKFASVEHRVISKRAGPRLSAACFIYPSSNNQNKPYGPLKELLSEGNPPKYRETSLIEFMKYYGTKGFDGVKSLPHFQFDELVKGGRL